jgi:hypothetical protein
MLCHVPLTASQDEETLRTFKENIKKQLMTRAPARGAHPLSAPIQLSSGRELPDGWEGRTNEGGINETGMPPTLFIDLSKRFIPSDVFSEPSA